jgi:hypothetical protein
MSKSKGTRDLHIRFEEKDFLRLETVARLLSLPPSTLAIQILHEWLNREDFGRRRPPVLDLATALPVEPRGKRKDKKTDR